LILDLLIFFIVYYLAFISLYSYGKQFKLFFFKDVTDIISSENDYTNIFFGIAFFVIFSWLYHFSFGFKNQWINLFILLFGVIIFLLDKTKTKIKSFYVIPLVLFSGIVIYNNHDDFHYYHFQNIIELTDNYPKIGIGNLNSKYVYASLFVYFESLFNFPHYQHHFFNIPRYLVFVTICGYLFTNIFNKKNNLSHFLPAVFLVFILIKFKRFSEHGYDYILTFFLIFIFVEYFYRCKKKSYNLKSIIFFFSIVLSLKATGIFFLPFIIFAIYKNYSSNLSSYYWLKSCSLGFVVSLIILLNSFLNSGCVFYPVKKTCFSSNAVNWSVNYDAILNESNVAKMWAKGFYHQKADNKINEYSEYAKNGRWILSWFNTHFLEKILDPVLIFISVFITYYVLGRASHKRYEDTKSNLILSLISLLFWLVTLPQLRFGQFYFFISIFLILFEFFNKDNKINNKCKIFIILGFVFFNFHNVKRIYYEFKQNLYFPWYQTLVYKTKLNKTNKINYNEYIKDKNNLMIIENQDINFFKYNLLFSEKKLKIDKKYNFIFFEKFN
jgi:hypothetical protein